MKPTDSVGGDTDENPAKLSLQAKYHLRPEEQKLVTMDHLSRLLNRHGRIPDVGLTAAVVKYHDGSMRDSSSIRKGKQPKEVQSRRRLPAVI